MFIFFISVYLQIVFLTLKSFLMFLYLFMSSYDYVDLNVSLFFVVTCLNIKFSVCVVDAFL